MHVTLTKWRLRRGLRWQGRYPDAQPFARELVKGIVIGTVLLVLVAITGRMEYRDAVAQEAEARALVAEAKRADAEEDLAGCLNGMRAWRVEDGFVRCRGAEVVR